MALTDRAGEQRRIGLAGGAHAGHVRFRDADQRAAGLARVDDGAAKK